MLVPTLVFAAVVLAGSGEAGPAGILVDEAGLRLQVLPDPPLLRVPLENRGAACVARLRVETLDSHDRVLSSIEHSYNLAAGASVLELALPPRLGEPPSSPWARLLGDRLRYAVDTDDGRVASGLRAVAQALVDAFELEATVVQSGDEGDLLPVHVIVRSLGGGAPLEGVEVEGRALAEGQDSPPVKGLTSSDGSVDLRVPLPDRRLPVTVRVRGRRGFEASLEFEVAAHASRTVLVTPDRPLYLPGQTLRLRLLAVDAGQRILPGRALWVRVTGPRGDLAHEARLETSRQGVATIDWPIPHRADEGEYEVAVREVNGATGWPVGRATVRVRRYELPVFRVLAQARSSFFLPGQPVELAVEAQSLTGRPVEDARVQVASGQTELAPESRTDATGRSIVRLDAGWVADRFPHDDGWARFEDVDVVVTVTDPVSRRNETRRCSLRLSRDALHVYWIEEDWQRVDGFPLRGWVSVFTADGLPTQAEVTLSGPARLRLRTGVNGLARVEGPALRESGPLRMEHLVIEARDGQGRRGRTAEHFYVGDHEGLRLEPGRFLLRPGQPLRALVRARPAQAVTVEARQGQELLGRRLVQAGPGGVTVSFAVPERVRGAVSLLAWPAETGPGVSSQVVTSVLYPEGRRFRLRLKTGKDRARPGEEVELEARLEDDGAPSVAAVGFAGVDLALLERAADDDPEPWFWGSLGDQSEMGGFSVATLLALDPSSPWPSGAEEAAGALVSRTGPWLQTETSEGPDVYGASQRAVRESLEPLQARLAREGEAAPPPSLAHLRSRAETASQGLLDPWGNPYALDAAFSPWQIALTATSRGPDEQPGGGDDISVGLGRWPSAAAQGARLQRALTRYLGRLTSWPPSLADLRPWLADEGLDPERLADPGGGALRLVLEWRGPRVLARLESLRADIPAPERTAWTASVDVFAPRRAVLATALERWAARAGRLPSDERELESALDEGHVPEEPRLDLDGRPWRALFRQESRFADRRSVESTGEHTGREKVTPVTEVADLVVLAVAGPDAVAAPPLATFRRVRGETGVAGPLTGPFLERREPVLSDDVGAVAGAVTDHQGEPVPGVTVTARNAGGRAVASAVTGFLGDYTLAPLPPGSYEVSFELTGFATSTQSGVEVQGGRRTALDVELAVAATNEVVTVMAEAPEVSTSSTTSGSLAQKPGASREGRPRATPRLRESFPETLLWEPEVLAGPDGRARARVRLPDSLTTWKLAALASTADGRLARAETEIVAWQPFAVELDPPSRLTAGDRLILDVPLRNDGRASRSVVVTAQAEAPLRVSLPAATRVLVPAGGMTRVDLDVRALSPGSGPALEVSAAGDGDGDRVRRRIEVVPDGEPVRESRAQVVGQPEARVTFEVPPEALSGSAWAELRLMPDLRAHVALAVEGARERPWGCAEQTVSAAFPSLLLLEEGGGEGELPESAVRYVREALDRLRNLETPAGGFSYWGWGEADLAVSAHALRFLRQAEPWAPGGQELALRAQRFLMARQNSDGTWPAPRGDGERAATLLTVQVARALAELAPAQREPALTAALERALVRLEPAADSIDEPYLIATLALLEERLGKREPARLLLDRLAALERREGDGAFWDLGTNTPFYGWGQAGRVETTGLVLQAFERLGVTEADRQLADRALLFLLRHQDAYGVWWSGQATVNVLEGLLARSARLPRGDSAPSRVQARLDGRVLPSVERRAGSLAPLRLVLGDDLSRGQHVLELSGLPGGAATLQIAAGHARPWVATGSGNPRSATGLVFEVRYGQRELRRGEEVTVGIEAGRVGFRGYGMLVAEVGLPPGVEVSRAGLDAALRHRSGLMRYELRPACVVLYLWPTAARTQLSFTFRPRFALEAATAPSRLFDYYNPLEEILLAPERFVVH